MNFLLSIEKNDFGTTDLLSKFNFGEVLIFGGQVLLIGMLAVFGVLATIWAVLMISQKIFSVKKATEPKVAAAPIATPAPVVEQNNDEEIIAVIAAAIAMAESESNGMKFKVVSFRRK